ncbi:SCO4848 family membrane protein [Cellulomonas denverensis]|uniref:Integral membrane protein n=1 Tax=Cellulomonas denverensis TaxID=264297 RepID=A0A7X6QZB5_9CELL|nr:hypothetical protein [Cellulomonas denverensis]NKY23018.1 hypothetical protein [Cellulomonas denverensis]GIG23902.1 hypothetical protein Cde04nite_01460 [Cellulomonas denverensis]
MDLPLAWSLLVLVAGLWNLIVWPRFGQRIAKDPRSRDAEGRATRFLTVHLVLIGISLVLGALLVVLGVLTLL